MEPEYALQADAAAFAGMGSCSVRTNGYKCDYQVSGLTSPLIILKHGKALKEEKGSISDNEQKLSIQRALPGPGED